MDHVYLPEKRVKARETRQVRPGRFGLMIERVILYFRLQYQIS